RPDATVDHFVALARAEAYAIFFYAAVAAAGNDGAELASGQLRGTLQPSDGRLQGQWAYAPVCFTTIDIVCVGLQELNMTARKQGCQYGCTAVCPVFVALLARNKGVSVLLDLPT